VTKHRFVRFLVISLFMLLSFFLITGCWDRRELDELFVAYTAGIDISDQNPEMLSLTLTGPTVEEKAESPTIEATGQGKSVQDAIDNIQSKLYREVVFGHAQILLFGEDTARQDITPFLDAFDRDPDVRGTLLLGVTQGKSADILVNANLKQHPYIGILLKAMFEGAYRESISYSVNLREFYRDFNSGIIDPCMPYLILSPTEDQLLVNNLAVFQGGRLAGVLDRDESTAAMLLMDKMQQGRISLPIPDFSNNPFYKSSSIYINRSRRKITPYIQDGDIKIGVEIKITAYLIEHSPLRRIIPLPDLEQLNRLYEQKLKQDMQRMLAKLQEYQSDIAGIGEYVRIKFPERFVKSQWRKDFTNLEFDITVTVNIRRMGAAT
jgi:spore germination protein KC